MVLMQKWPFFQDFLLFNIDQKNVSYDILQLKERLSRLTKTTSSQSRKPKIFPNGLTHGFGQKMAIFPSFFLSNICQENVFYHILKRKKVFLRYKNKKTSQAKTLTRFP